MLRVQLSQVGDHVAARRQESQQISAIYSTGTNN